MKKSFGVLLVVLLALGLFAGGCIDLGYVVERTLEGDLDGDFAGWAELEIINRNGLVKVVPIAGSEFKIDLEMRVRTATRSEAEEVAEKGLKVTHKEDLLGLEIEDERISARITASVPRDLYYNASIQTSNGGITLEELEMGEVELRASNGSIDLKGISFDKLQGRTSNGSLRTEGIYGDTLELESSNGRVNLKGAARVFDIRTSNGRMELKPDFLSDRPELIARTSNGRIEMQLPRDSSTGFSVRGNTSNGEFTYDQVAGAVTLGSDRMETTNFSSMLRQVNIELSTSNSDIDVKDR